MTVSWILSNTYCNLQDEKFSFTNKRQWNGTMNEFENQEVSWKCLHRCPVVEMVAPILKHLLALKYSYLWFNGSLLLSFSFRENSILSTIGQTFWSKVTPAVPKTVRLSSCAIQRYYPAVLSSCAIQLWTVHYKSFLSFLQDDLGQFKALRRQIQSLIDFVLNHCFWIPAMFSKCWQWLRINLSLSPIWFTLIWTRGMTWDNFLLSRFSSFFALHVTWGSLVSAVAYFLSLKARNSMNFQPITRFWSLKSFHNPRDRVIFPWACSCHRYFSIFNQASKIFLRHPVDATNNCEVWNSSSEKLSSEKIFKDRIHQ